MDGLSIKCVIEIFLFVFHLKFNENWWSCSYLCELKLHQVSLNLNENKKVALMKNLTDGLSIMGRWIRPIPNPNGWEFSCEVEKMGVDMSWKLAVAGCHKTLPSQWTSSLLVVVVLAAADVAAVVVASMGREGVIKHAIMVEFTGNGSAIICQNSKTMLWQIIFILSLCFCSGK